MGADFGFHPRQPSSEEVLWRMLPRLARLGLAIDPPDTRGWWSVRISDALTGHAPTLDIAVRMAFESEFGEDPSDVFYHLTARQEMEWIERKEIERLQAEDGHTENSARLAGMLRHAEITAIQIADCEDLDAASYLEIDFSDGRRLTLADKAEAPDRSSRYMTCDDEFANLLGSTFLGYHVCGVRALGSDGEAHDVQSLLIRTTGGDFNIANHNLHNGDSAGFAFDSYLRKVIDDA